MEQIVIPDNIQNRVSHYFGNHVGCVKILMQMGNATKETAEGCR